MMTDTIRAVSDRVNYSDDEPSLNVNVIRQLVADNNVCLWFIDQFATCFYYQSLTGSNSICSAKLLMHHTVQQMTRSLNK